MAWLVVEGGGIWLEGAVAAVAFAGAATVYGLGECFHGPNYGPLVADLAPRGLEGRYWAVSSGSWELGYVLGPAVGGFVLATAPFVSSRSPPRRAWWPPPSPSGSNGRSRASYGSRPHEGSAEPGASVACPSFSAMHRSMDSDERTSRQVVEQAEASRSA